MDLDLPHHHFTPVSAATALPGADAGELRRLGAPQKAPVLPSLASTKRNDDETHRGRDRGNGRSFFGGNTWGFSGGYYGIFWGKWDEVDDFMEDTLLEFLLENMGSFVSYMFIWGVRQQTTGCNWILTPCFTHTHGYSSNITQQRCGFDPQRRWSHGRENRCHFVKCWCLAKVEDGPGFQWRPILTQILVDSHICHSNSCCIIVFDHNPTVSLFHITAYVFVPASPKKMGAGRQKQKWHILVFRQKFV